MIISSSRTKDARNDRVDHMHHIIYQREYCVITYQSREPSIGKFCWRCRCNTLWTLGYHCLFLFGTQNTFENYKFWKHIRIGSADNLCIDICIDFETNITHRMELFRASKSVHNTTFCIASFLYKKFYTCIALWNS